MSAGPSVDVDALTRAGIEHLIARRLEDALDAFGHALAGGGRDPRALHGIGLMGLRFGQTAHALRLLEVAATRAETQLAGEPQSLAKINADLAEAYYLSGRLPEAIEAWGASLRAAHDQRVRREREAAIDLLAQAAADSAKDGEYSNALRLLQMVGAARPKLASAPRRVAELYLEHGNTRDAVPSLREAVAREHRSADTIELARALGRLGEHDEVIALLEPLRKRGVKDPRARLLLAGSLAAVGRTDESRKLLERSLASRPNDPEILRRLGETAAARGAIDEARQWLERAVAVDSTHRAQLALAELLLDTGRHEEAVRHFDALAKAAPENPRVHRARARLLALHRVDDAAIRGFARAAELAPGDPANTIHLADALTERGASAQARNLLRELEIRQPASGIALLRSATFLPALPAGGDPIGALREGLELLRDARPRCSITEAGLLRAPGWLLRHEPVTADPADARALREAIAEAYRSACPALGFAATHTAAPARTGRRLRVAFCASSFGGDPIGRRWREHVARLDRKRFEVFLVRPPARAIANGDVAVDRLADGVLRLPESLAAAQRAIAALAPDAIVYPALAGDDAAYRLAFARLAGVQCASWDHPATSGLATIDYFLSSAAAEPPEGDAHYSERLVRLPGLPSLPQRERPQAAPRDRAAFTGAADRPLMVVAASLAKLTPAFDSLIAGILRATPTAILAIVDAAPAGFSKLVRERVKHALGEASARVRYLERPDAEGFEALLAAADVVLDPLGVGGCEASFTALGLGTPVVTLAGPALRSRRTLAMLRTLGDAAVIESLACADVADYAAAVIRLATDPVHRAHTAAAIRAGFAQLVDPAASVAAFAEFLESATPRG